MFLLRLTVIIFFIIISFAQNAFCASSFRVKDLILDNSDRIIFIGGEGNFQRPKEAVYVPIPTGGQASNSVNLITNITAFTITSPFRYVIDIPNARLDGASRTYDVKNSSIIKSVQLAQFSSNPDIVRIVFTLNKQSDLSKFKTYTNGKNIIIKYNSSIIDNSIKYKFYTPNGDMDKSIKPQNTGAVLTYNNNNNTLNLIPRMQTKYYLSKVSQNSDGLILRGIGSISLQKTTYSSDNKQAVLILDNATLASKLNEKTYTIPSSQKNEKAYLTINAYTDKKIKLTLNGDTLRDYRFVVSPDGQSLFVSHRSYIINTIFSSDTALVNSYKIEKNSAGYSIFDIVFNKAVTYDVFELNDNFYIDINNLGDYNEALFKQMLKTTDIKIQALKISSDKTRFIIPMKDLNFAYANVESNAKSIQLCFKDKPKTPTKQENEVLVSSNNPKDENINVTYVPKEDNSKVMYVEKPKKSNPTISAMKKVVLDPGHGGSDSGAIGGGYYEKTLNLEVAKLVAEKLTKKNVYVYMTRSKDTTVSLEDRTNYSNEINPDIYVSIHTNSTVQGDSYGLETHYYKDDSYSLAQLIHSKFASEKNLKKWDTKDRGVIKSRFYVINHTEAPSVLIEMGFISNTQEREKLFTKDRQEQIANSIAEGILEYLKVK